MQGVVNTVIKRFILTIGLFTVIFGVIFGLTALQDTRAATTGTFNVSLTIGNTGPEIIWVNQSISESPTEGGPKIITVIFNASDENGAADIDISTANLTFNFTGETTRFSTDCAEQASNGNVMTVQCNITMNYYDAAGDWTINASIKDDAGTLGQNTSQTMTWGQLAAMTVIKSDMTFSGSPGDNNLAPAENPQIINNTGNRDFATVNITGYELVGASDDGYTIGAGNFTINVSNSADGYGDQIVNATSIEITEASLPRGDGSTEDLYLRMDVPSGILAQNYNAAELWEIEVTES